MSRGEVKLHVTDLYIITIENIRHCSSSLLPSQPNKKQQSFVYLVTKTTTRLKTGLTYSTLVVALVAVQAIGEVLSALTAI